MFGLFKKSADQITPDKINKVTLIATKGAFDLACAVTTLSSKRDEENFRHLYAETLALATCLIQMRAQVKYKFNNPKELVKFFDALWEEYEAHYKSDWSTNPVQNNHFGLTLKKDVFKFALSPYFKNRTILYGCCDYVSLGISEEAFDIMAKSLCYVPAVIKRMRDDMALLIYQILIIKFMADDIPENKQAETSIKFVRATKEAKATWVMMFDKMLVWP